MSRPKPPESCPVCGEDVPRKALACPECGADHNSGWRPDADSIGQAGDDDDFDYEEFVQNEFGGGAKPKRIQWVWWITAILLLLAFLYPILRHTIGP